MEEISPEMRRLVREVRIALEDVPKDEVRALMRRALVNLVRSGGIAEADFNSPDHYRAFCDEHGIEQ